MNRTNGNSPRPDDPFGRTQMPSTNDEQRWTRPDTATPQTGLSGQPAIRPPLPIAMSIVPQQAIPSNPSAPISMAAPTMARARTASYRPTRRPTTALVMVCDDVGSGGEWFRVREELCVVGRSEGQIRIPHDPAISSKHFQLRLVTTQRPTGETVSEWLLEDLGSRNGTYVKFTNAPLVHGLQFMIGNRLFRLDMPASASSRAVPVDVAANATTDWSSMQNIAAQPSATLVEIPPQRPQGGRKFKLAKSVVRIGSDAAQCEVAVTNDPFVCPFHAQLSQQGRDGWRLIDLGSVNGCWLWVDKHPIIGTVDVQIGEQRLRIQLGGID